MSIPPSTRAFSRLASATSPAYGRSRAPSEPPQPAAILIAPGWRLVFKPASSEAASLDLA